MTFETKFLLQQHQKALEILGIPETERDLTSPSVIYSHREKKKKVSGTSDANSTKEIYRLLSDFLLSDNIFIIRSFSFKLKQEELLNQ